jgi:colicin import membrane protein
MGKVSYLPATIISLLLHALVISFVLKGWGVPDSPKVFERPAFIKATIVDLKTQGMNSAPKSVAKPKAVPKEVNLENRREEAAKKQAAETRRKQQLAQKEAEAKSKQDNLKRQALAKEKALAAEKAKVQAQQDAQRIQEQAQATREALEQERLRENFERERASLRAEQQAELAAVELATDNIAALSYADAIRRRVEENWSRPPSARNGMKVDLRIQLVPTGTVVNVAILNSSGNAAFDRSAIRAVERIGQFSEIKTMPARIFEREFRQFTLLFQPQDLRQ